MIKLRQIEPKNQYSLKRNNSLIKIKENSLHDDRYLSIHNNYIEPLQGNSVSFKGFKVLILKELKPSTQKIPTKLVQKVFESLEKISSEQAKVYEKIKDDYVKLIKSNPEISRALGYSAEVLEKITPENLYYIPKNRLLKQFFTKFFSPITSLYKTTSNLFKSKEALLEAKRNEKIIKDFSSLEGLIKSHEIWENGYRKASGNAKWRPNSDFLIPDDILQGKINRRRKKFVDPEKGKYSMTSLMLGNRFISGVIYSYFLGTDAYNTTMRYSNNKQEATTQRNSRIAQEFSRIGLNMYIQNLLYGTFETAVNRSLGTALFVSGSTAAFSEILGRKLVGKPIMPSDKETLDRLEREMAEKKGVLPAIGRLLTNVKKKNVAIQPEPSLMLGKSLSSNNSSRIYKSFVSTNNTKTSFKGHLQLDKLMKNYYEVEKMLNKKEILDVLNALKHADKKEYQSILKTITKALNQSESFQKFKTVFLSKNPDKKHLFESVEEILKIEELTQIPMGKQHTKIGQLTKSILVPIDFVKSIVTGTINFSKKMYQKITGRTNDYSIKQLEKFLASTTPADARKIEQFNNYYLERLNLPAWKKSIFSEQEKKIRIFEEFKEVAGKDGEEIQGAKNILLWLNDQMKKEGIKIQQNGTLSDAHLSKVKEIMQKAVMQADGSKHVEYNGNTIAQTNIHLSRAITTLFLVTDAYNLTMQYSNDNKKDANKSAKNRAAQEISRISVSAYIMAFVHNLLGKLCNSSLAGAFTLTALTSSINDSLSRKVVGVPLTQKTKEQLDALDKENIESKNPIKKALAYSIGKKSAIVKNASVQPPLSFADRIFLKPEIK